MSNNRHNLLNLRGSIRRAVPGQSLVEFAIALPFLLILFMVMVEVGFLLRTHTTIVSAVRESTRIASASGNLDPYNSDWSLSLVDGDTQIVGEVNTVARDYVNNINLLMTYRADSTAGRTSYTTGGGSGDGTSKVWPIVVTSARYVSIFQTANYQNNQPYQHVFARASGTTGKFSTQVLTGTACSSALSAAGLSVSAPYSASLCGKNWNPSDTSNSGANQPPRKAEIYDLQNTAHPYTPKFAQDPWYPTFRRCSDIDQGITSDLSQANTSSTYFNNPQTSPHWIGVRIDYTYNWFTGFFPLPSLRLSDRSVKILEPNPVACN